MRNTLITMLFLVTVCTVTAYAQDDWELQIVGATITTGQAQAVANSGIYGFIADGDYGFISVDLSNPTFPTQIGSFNNGGIVSDLIVEGNYAYLAHWARGLTVLDISNPAQPESVITFNTPGSVIDLYKNDNMMALADFFNGLVILDVTDVNNISQLGFVSQLGAISVAAHDSVVYLGSQSMGLVTYSIADIANPVVADFDQIATDCNDIVIYENFLLLACGQAGMLVYDISDPSQPDSITAFNTTGTTNRIAVKDTIAYLADNENGLVAVNISDPRNPQLIQILSTPSTTNGVGFFNDFVLVADGWMMLVVYYDSYSDLDEPGQRLPERVKLHDCYPNPFNPSTMISFELKSASNVTIDIYDIQGRKVTRLIDGFYDTGNYNYEWNASGNPSGMYFIRLYGDGESSSTKALFLK